ncbi:50S ribosomal protein L39e [Candidatus Woesearchaeota archaeon]|nr:50S ribosomal protein L39e [Candidatus Woesearchaeota archaeon]
MATFKHLSRKLRLAKLGRLTRWAPYWIIPKKHGKGKKIHPARDTRIKRSWRRTKTKA